MSGLKVRVCNDVPNLAVHAIEQELIALQLDEISRLLESLP